MSSSRVHCTRHRRADLLRQERRLDHEVALRLAAEAAAEQRDVDGHVLDRHRELLGHVLARAVGALDRRPDLDLAVRDVGQRDRRLHRDVRHVRLIVLGADDLGRACERRVRIALLADHLAGLGGGRRHLLVVLLGVVDGVRAVVPLDLERVAALDRCPGVAGDDGDAAERRELRRRHAALELHDLLDAGDRLRGAVVDRLDLAADHRRPRDHRILHARQLDIGAVDRLAGGDVVQVEDRHVALADVAELALVLERQRRGGRVRVLLRRHLHLRHGLRRDRRSRACRPEPSWMTSWLLALTSATSTPHCLAAASFSICAHRRADLAHRLDVVAHAARAVGVLVAVLRLIARRLDDLHARPVGLHLVGDHHRQAGPRAGAHLGAVGDDRDRAVGGDRDEDMRVGDDAVRHVEAAVRFRSRTPPWRR